MQINQIFSRVNSAALRIRISGKNSQPCYFSGTVFFSFESILLAGMIVVARITQSKVVHQYGGPEMV